MNKYHFRLFFLFYIILFSGSACLPFMTSSVYAASSEVIEYDDWNAEIIPSSADIEWRYKYINGTLYKRKYNKTTHEWVGSWIKA